MRNRAGCNLGPVGRVLTDPLSHDVFLESIRLDGYGRVVRRNSVENQVPMSNFIGEAKLVADLIRTNIVQICARPRNGKGYSPTNETAGKSSASFSTSTPVPQEQPAATA